MDDTTQATEATNAATAATDTTSTATAAAPAAPAENPVEAQPTAQATDAAASPAVVESPAPVAPQPVADTVAGAINEPSNPEQPAAPVADTAAQTGPVESDTASALVAAVAPVDKQPVAAPAPAYVGEAPAAPYYLIDTEHGKINEIASHLDKLRDEAIKAIETISTEFSHWEVAQYKGDLLAWLRKQ